jgi:hypothetical protein
MRVGNEQISLSTESIVITSEELKSLWTGTSGSTIIFYINPTIKDRTSVSGNEYASVIKIGDKQTFKLLVAADAGRGYSTSPAQFEVYVTGTGPPDIIEIPNFPLQRWTCVAIVRKGRKFNIYINGKLTVSHTCTAMPIFDGSNSGTCPSGSSGSNIAPLRVGNVRLGGSIALMSIAPYPMQGDEVRSIVESTVDSDGKPYLSSELFTFMPIPMFNISFNAWCPGGNCNASGKIGSHESWNAGYA